MEFLHNVVNRPPVKFDVPMIQNCPTVCCVHCKGQFSTQSQYEGHMMQNIYLIHYVCRICNDAKLYYNFCSIQRHIRSHLFNDTVNNNDVIVDPSQISKPTLQELQQHVHAICYECKQLLPKIGTDDEDRAAHFMQYTFMTYYCPYCYFTFTTKCAIDSHIKFHLQLRPLYNTQLWNELRVWKIFILHETRLCKDFM